VLLPIESRNARISECQTDHFARSAMHLPPHTFGDQRPPRSNPLARLRTNVILTPARGNLWMERYESPPSRSGERIAGCSTGLQLHLSRNSSEGMREFSCASVLISALPHFSLEPLDGNGRRKRFGLKRRKAGGVGVKVELTQLPFVVTPTEHNTLRFGPSTVASWFTRSGLAECSQWPLSRR